MSREQMIDHICEAVRNADTNTVEECFWFLLMELGI